MITSALAITGRKINQSWLWGVVQKVMGSKVLVYVMRVSYSREDDGGDWKLFLSNGFLTWVFLN